MADSMELDQHGNITRDLAILDNVLHSLTPNGQIHYEIQNIIAKYRETSSESSPKMKNYNLLKIVLNSTSRIELAHVSRMSSFDDLKRKLEDELSRRLNILVAEVASSNLSITTLDSRTLEELGISDGDTISITESSTVRSLFNETTAKQGIIATSLDRLRQYQISSNSPIHAIAVAAHSFLLDQNFVTQVQSPSTLAGFAPSIRDLPRSQFLPNDWDTDPTMTTFLYKHAAKPNKIFSLVTMGVLGQDEVVLALSEKAGSSFKTKLNVAQHIRFEPSGSTISWDENILTDVTAFEAALLSLVYQLLPSLNKDSRTGDSRDNSSSTSAPSPSFGPPSTGQGQGRRGEEGIRFPRVGEGDLFPASGPFLQPVPPAGSGSFVGPDHPIFGGGDDWPGVGRGGVPRAPGFGPGFPAPRFDPLGPVVGPFGPDIGEGPDIPGGPGWGRGSRAGGRGSGAVRLPGEPNPDHFRPPSW